MDARTLAALEFDSLKGLIGAFVRTPSGRRSLEQLAPTSDVRDATARRARAAEAMRHHLEGGRLGPGGMDDPEPILDRLRPEGSVLDAIEISRLLGVIEAAGALRRALEAQKERWPRLWEVAIEIPDLSGVSRAIAGKIGADGRLEDAASPDLARLRRRMAELEGRLQRSLQAVLDRSVQQGLLQDAYVTVRNGRFVIPVRAEARGSVPGIVHGASGTGATLFVEPMETLDMNNELAISRDEEQAEVRRLLAEWSALLRSRLAEISRAAARAGELDLLGAIAVFAVNHRCTVAGNDARERLVLLEARHPLLEAGLRVRGVEPVPLTVEMTNRGGVLVLSGPNAGGKTVALKTIGLLVLMHQAGLPVPAREAMLPDFRQVMADIGDHQSILESLSTFSARMVRVAEILKGLEPPSLVLVDEVGSGTDPEEAGALAVAIVDHLRGRGACVVATTHHEALKAYAELADGAINAAMEFDAGTMRPTYRLASGVAGRSGGVDLAERVGLPREVVTGARSRLSEGHRETLEYAARLKELAASREREEASLKRQREELEERRRELEASLARTISESRERWRTATEAALAHIEQARERFLAGIEDRAVALQVRAEARRESRTLREQLEQAIAPVMPDTPRPRAAPGGASPAADHGAIRPGMQVRVAGQIATVESVDRKGRAAVMVRGKRMTVRLSELEPAPVEDSARSRKLSWTLPSGVKFVGGDRQGSPAELNLIGATVEEALDRLDKFLDDSYLAGHTRVRVVHGHGTGRLRAAVHKMLASHPHVESHAAADERAGGTGATIVTVRG